MMCESRESILYFLKYPSLSRFSDFSCTIAFVLFSIFDEAKELLNEVFNSFSGWIFVFFSTSENKRKSSTRRWLE